MERGRVDLVFVCLWAKALFVAYRSPHLASPFQLGLLGTPPPSPAKSADLKRQKKKKKEKERKKDRHRGCSDASMSQEFWATPGSWEEVQKHSPCIQREHGPADTLALAFWPRKR